MATIRVRAMAPMFISLLDSLLHFRAYADQKVDRKCTSKGQKLELGEVEV